MTGYLLPKTPRVFGRWTATEKSKHVCLIGGRAPLLRINLVYLPVRLSEPGLVSWM
ncbi:861_t:CDS:2 [Funneliformis caledonium]|uniref:861_t:CDS:1 n=1 Tax=Funneliformis caledonium TaxID=1117310 RepID=A0A9N9CC31_9GLOM|nr:861_t:CDS:2 [Funneliformis caledonium]